MAPLVGRQLQSVIDKYLKHHDIEQACRANGGWQRHIIQQQMYRPRVLHKKREVQFAVVQMKRNTYLLKVKVFTDYVLAEIGSSSRR